MTGTTATVNVKDLGALGNGSTDDAAAINAADVLVSATGGTLMFPPGVYIAGAALVRNPNVIWQGDGIGSTIIRQKAGTSLSSLVQTLNAYSLFGSGSIAGPAAIGFRDMSFDGNKNAGCFGDGLAIYAPTFNIDNIEVSNCTGTGIRTEFGTPGLIGHGYNAQSNMNNSLIHDCDSVGVRWGGPSDSSVVNCNVYRNLVYNFWCAGPDGTGIKLINCHFWGSIFDQRMATVGLRLDTAGNLVVNCAAEGSSVHQIHVRSSTNYIVGGNVYYNSDAANTYGVTLGDSGVTVISNTVQTRIDNCRAGAVYFANSLGQSHINVQGYNSGTVPSWGFQGMPDVTDEVHLQMAGDVAVNNGNVLYLPGYGRVFSGRPNSGGSGYRALCVAN